MRLTATTLPLRKHIRLVAPGRPGCPLQPDHYMTHTLEISLRIPSLRVRREGQEALETIVNTDIRFTKQIELDAVPKVGDVLTMTVGSGGTFQCEVVRSDWRDDKNMFVAACRYSRRTIPEREYQALKNAPDWHERGLL